MGAFFLLRALDAPAVHIASHIWTQQLVYSYKNLTLPAGRSIMSRRSKRYRCAWAASHTCCCRNTLGEHPPDRRNCFVFWIGLACEVELDTQHTNVETERDLLVTFLARFTISDYMRENSTAYIRTRFRMQKVDAISYLLYLNMLDSQWTGAGKELSKIMSQRKNLAEGSVLDICCMH